MRTRCGAGQMEERLMGGIKQPELTQQKGKVMGKQMQIKGTERPKIDKIDDAAELWMNAKEQKARASKKVADTEAELLRLVREQGNGDYVSEKHGKRFRIIKPDPKMQERVYKPDEENEEDELDTMTVPELRDRCHEMKIDIPAKAHRETLVQAIRAAQH